AGDAGVELFEVDFRRPRLEGDRERPTMQAVLVEIAQHQSARKQTVEDRGPSECRGEILLRIEQDQLVGVGPEQGHIGLTEDAGAIDEAVALDPSLDETLRVGEDAQRVADERPAVIARNMRGAARPSRPVRPQCRSSVLLADAGYHGSPRSLSSGSTGRGRTRAPHAPLRPTERGLL